MEISRPIFIIGVPRSGTTLLYNLMAQHKDLAWFSQYDLSKVFSKEFLHFYKLRKRLFDIREWSYGKLDMPNYEVLFDAPIEFPQFWNRHIGQDWADEKDVDDSSKKHLRETISQIIISKNKKRFLSKYPRNSVRISYLNKVFPGSIFVNIVRDGRAVVASMLNRILWNHVSYFRNNTSNVNELTFAKMDGYFGIPLKNGNQSQFNFLETHALQWIEVLEEINKAKNYLKPEQFFELKYEDFVLDPKKWLTKIFSACGLEQQNVFQNKIIRVLGKREMEEISENLSGRNESWKTKFSQTEIERLNKIMKIFLERFEYL